MSKVIKVGVFFNFYPEGEHAELFEGMTQEEIVKSAEDMAYDDISRVVHEGRLGLNLDTEIIEEKN